MFWFIVGAALVALATAAVISAETIIEYLKERKKVLNISKNLKGRILDKLREGDYYKVDVGLYDVDDKYIETVPITGDEISDEIYVGMELEV